MKRIAQWLLLKKQLVARVHQAHLWGLPIEIEGETLVKAHCTGGASTEGKKDLLGEVEGKEAGRE